MMAGHVNGSGRKPTDDEKVASLDEARRRAAARARAKVDGRTSAGGPRGSMTTRDWVIGAVVTVMAAGMLWHWLAPLVGAKGLVR